MNHRTIALLSGLSWVLLEGLPAQDGHRAAELGVEFDRPGKAWQRVAPLDAAGGGRKFDFRNKEDENRTISLIVWPAKRRYGLEALLDSEQKQMKARGTVEPIDRVPRRVAGRNGRSTRYRLSPVDRTPPLAIDATYFQTRRHLLRLAVTVPADEAKRLDGIVAAAAKSLRLVAPRSAEAARAGKPVDFGKPDPEHVLTIVTRRAADEPDFVYRFLEALPGAARRNNGSPAILAVGDSLDDSARAFLSKYRPGVIRHVGPAHPELPQARPAKSGAAVGGSLVVCAKRLAPAVQAACLALRLRCALVIGIGGLKDRVAAIQPERLLVVGDLELPDGYLRDAGVRVERLDGPAEIAKAAGGANYIALCNVTPGRGAESAALAAVLAGIRNGVVLPLEIPTKRTRVPLRVTRVRPKGLEESPRGEYLLGRIRNGGVAVLAGATRTTEVRVSKNQSPRYGRLRIDLDGDGILEASEEPRIGSTIRLGDRRCHLSYHYGHSFVGYLRPEVVLEDADRASIRSSIRALSEDLGGAEYLAVVGTPGRVPFCYREAEGYFETFDIKQELPTDAPYANLDDDLYLELAVGRLPVEDLVAGSAVIATTVTYQRLKGDWLHRATVIQPGFHELEGSLPWVLPNAEALIRGIEGDLVSRGIEAAGFYRSDVAMDDVLTAMSRSAWIAYFNHSGPGTWGIHPGASIVTKSRRRGSDRLLPALAGAPIVFGGGCSSAALDVGQPLEATFPGRFFQLGAVAYLGNTRVAYARSEHLIQLFFARLAAGGCTIGQAYRHGRNFLAHLLESGHLVDPLEAGIQMGIQDFLWGQHRIMNLFGDPALMPRFPDVQSGAAIGVELRATGEPNRRRLVVTNRGVDRRDPIQMMPAPGQGSPREFFARTGPGMTSSHTPGRFARRGLAPVRTTPEIQPGAWVDVELPVGATDVSVSLAEGPRFAERGFSVVPGVRGEPRLLMYVPLVNATFEKGDGAVARRVEFDVSFGVSDDPVAERRSAPIVKVAPRWTPDRLGAPRVSGEAREILERIRKRHRRLRHDPIDWRLRNPQPRLYGDRATFRGTWRGDRTTLEVDGLPGTLRPRTAQIEAALQFVADLAFASPLPSLEGMRVEASKTGDLVLLPLEDDEGAERTVIRADRDGTVTRIVRRQFGVAEEVRFAWRTTSRGPVLQRRTSFDPARPGEAELVHEIEYGEDGWPHRVTLRIHGRLPRDVLFEFARR